MGMSGPLARRGIGAFAAVVVGLVCLTGSAPAIHPGSGPSPVTFVAVGDSLTNANSDNFPGRDVGDLSWVHYVTGGEFVGGWARGGAQTSDMVVNARPTSADVLVVLAGTNDLAHGCSFEVISRNLVAITRKVGVARVIVAALPPRDSTPEAITEFNRELEAFADGRGWTFVDPMAGLRSGDRYAVGMSRDGLHPNRAGAEILGHELSRAIADVGE
jgi:lysophospholipase L1-like esterase